MRPDTAVSLPDKLVLVPTPFAVPDGLKPFAELVTFSSSAAAWERSSPNERDARDITDADKTHLSWPPDASSGDTDSSVVGRYADSLEASKSEGSSAVLSLGVFLRFSSSPLFFPSGVITFLYRLFRSSSL